MQQAAHSSAAFSQCVPAHRCTQWSPAHACRQHLPAHISRQHMPAQSQPAHASTDKQAAHCTGNAWQRSLASHQPAPASHCFRQCMPAHICYRQHMPAQISCQQRTPAPMQASDCSRGNLKHSQMLCCCACFPAGLVSGVGASSHSHCADVRTRVCPP